MVAVWQGAVAGAVGLCLIWFLAGSDTQPKIVLEKSKPSSHVKTSTGRYEPMVTTFTTPLGIPETALMERAGHTALQEEMDLLKWSIENGANLENVVPHVFDFGSYKERGVRAEREFDQGQLIATIPANLTMWCSRAVYGPPLHGVLQHMQSLNATCQGMLALWLIYERSLGDRSFWHHYVKVTEKAAIGSAPLFVSENKFAEFDPVVQAEATTLLESIQTEHAVALASVGPEASRYAKKFKLEPHVNEPHYRWAYQMVLSRTWFYSYDEVDEVIMAPIMDLLNHGHPSDANNLEMTIQEDGSLHFTATKRIEAGEQLFFDYSYDNCRSTWVVHYGYAPPGVKTDC